MDNQNLPLFTSVSGADLTNQATGLLHDLFPICRSLTGDGVRQTLGRLRLVAAFEIMEIPSGTRCYDWTVPDEWAIRDAYIESMDGKRVIDFRNNNLHVVGYSTPVDAVMSFDELAASLHTLPHLPQAIPYRTSYYHPTWGFCLSHQQLMGMDRSQRYRVRIDSTLKPGSLTYGERLLRGTSGQEYLITSYCCHPSMGNDSLSGQVLWTLLLAQLASRKLRHSYRFVIGPETIGAIAYLSQHESEMKRIAGGLVITTVAGPGQFGFKRSFVGNHIVDRAARLAFRDLGLKYIEYPFDIHGSDERHYSSPHFRIPMATICKDKYHEYEYYHTSLDDLRFVSGESLVKTLAVYGQAIENLELNETYRSLHPYCEPMLSKRGLYPTMGGQVKQSDGSANPAEGRVYGGSNNQVIHAEELDATLWMMFYADGLHDVLDIAEKTGLPVRLLHIAAEHLCAHKLLEPIKRPEATLS